MDVPSKTKLIDLLREREAAFMRVWECERRIDRILGDVYPFPPPPPLPSARKGKKPRKAKAAPTKTRPVSLRRLQGEYETAYRVCYEIDGVAGETFQTDTDLIRHLLATPFPGLKVTGVETVHFRGLDDWSPVESLFPEL